MAKSNGLDPKAIRVILFVALAAAVAFALPKPKYQSLNVLKDITVPMRVGAWTGEDVKTDIKLMDGAYNFINSLFLREYSHPSGQKLYLYLLDAGNFHNPKVCLTSAGFSMKELDDIDFAVATSDGCAAKDACTAEDANKSGPPAAAPFTAPTVMIAKDEAQFLVSYWITINGKRVDWTEQKVKEFFFSLVGAKKAGLMIRIDTPVTEKLIPAAREGLKNFVSELSAALAEKDHKLIFGR